MILAARAVRKIINMDEFVAAAAGMGLPAVMLLVVMATTGLFGAAAITTALAMLGDPAGMLGGIALLGIVGSAANMLSRHSLEALLVAIYRYTTQEWEPQNHLCQQIESLL